MTDIRRSGPSLAALVLVLAACGGGGGGNSSAAPATSGPTQATATEAPAASTEPAGGGGGGSAADVCGLVTPDELAKIFNLPSVKTTVLLGPPDTCTVEAEDGTSLAAWVLTRVESAAAPVYDAMMGDPSAIQVSGIGDKAAHVQNTGLLVLKGDALLSIGLMTGVGDLSEEEQRQLAEKLATIAAGRM